MIAHKNISPCLALCAKSKKMGECNTLNNDNRKPMFLHCGTIGVPLMGPELTGLH